MNCGCPLCGTLTIHEVRGMESRCVCPNCGWVCRDCLGDGNGRFAPLTKEEAEKMRSLVKKERSE